MFGLKPEQLAEVVGYLSGINGGKGVGYTIANPEEDFRGYNGEKAIVEFDVTVEGRITQFRCFAKKMNFGFSEAEIYQSLNQVDAPVPQMYYVTITSDGSEVVFLELLEQVGINSKNETEFAHLLRTLAEFNAVDIGTVPPYQPKLFQEQASWLRSAWEAAYMGKLGPKLAEVFANLPKHSNQLKHYLEETVQALSSRPQDTTHHDPANANVGYDKNNRLVLLDLHYVTAFPRFKDLALRLGGSASSFPVQTNIDEWIAIYLETYNRLKRSHITVKTCKQEMETLKRAQRLYFSEQCFNEAVEAFDNGDEQMQLGYQHWLTDNYHYIIEFVG